VPGTAFDNPVPALDQHPEHLCEAHSAEAELLQLGVGIAGRQPPVAPLTEHEAVLDCQHAAVAGGDLVEASPSCLRHAGDEVAVEVRASRPVAEVAELSPLAPVGSVLLREPVEVRDRLVAGDRAERDLVLTLQLSQIATVDLAL
jgi:hypothetical protein